jgi:L-ascorbate metabolism protein UlaG (beta-lactamase superfamily)
MKTTHLGLLLILFVVLAQAISGQETKIKWFDHAAFQIITPKGKVLLIDPWIGNPLNPAAANGKDALAEITKADPLWA